MKRSVLMVCVALLLLGAGCADVLWMATHSAYDRALWRETSFMPGYGWQKTISRYGDLSGLTGLKFEASADFAGGLFTVSILRGFLEGANPKWFTVIVTDAVTGEEITRRAGDDDVPDYWIDDVDATSDEESPTVWHDFLNVGLPRVVAHSLKVDVIEAPEGNRFEWIVPGYPWP